MMNKPILKQDFAKSLGIAASTISGRLKRGWSLEAAISTGSLARGIDHGHTVNARSSRTYKSWRAMRARCKNETDSSYGRYGAVGISVCERWESFASFLADMGERPKAKSLDRISNSGNYEPSNCRWADAFEQAANRHNTKLITIGSRTLPLRGWAREVGLPHSTISRRIERGMSPDQAIVKIKS